jgi:phage N-6-adenine-methyltransferase
MMKRLQKSDVAKPVDPADDCFATPKWLFEVLDAEYHFALDAAATKESAKCHTFFTPNEDGLKQDWSKASKGNAVFVNPPYAFGELEKWVDKAHQEAQQGTTVVMLLPLYKSYPWFRDVVWKHAEVRMIWGPTIYSGFGPQAGKCAGNRGRSRFDSLVAVFRKGQKAKIGEYVIKPTQAA